MIFSVFLNELRKKIFETESFTKDDVAGIFNDFVAHFNDLFSYFGVGSEWELNRLAYAQWISRQSVAEFCKQKDAIFKLTYEEFADSKQIDYCSFLECNRSSEEIFNADANQLKYMSYIFKIKSFRESLDPKYQREPFHCLELFIQSYVKPFIEYEISKIYLAIERVIKEKLQGYQIIATPFLKPNSENEYVRLILYIDSTYGIFQFTLPVVNWDKEVLTDEKNKDVFRKSAWIDSSNYTEFLYPEPDFVYGLPDLSEDPVIEVLEEKIEK